MLVVARATAQQQPNPRAGMTHDSSLVRDTTNFGVMDMAVKPVRLPPKPNATPQLNTAQRDALEHQLHCQCGGCTLDVFTCRTTDFSCQVSPAMHRDVMALVEGGYSAQEIIDAFVGTYGQRVLMAPPRSGFNILAWVSPGIAVLVAGAFILAFLRRSQARGPSAARRRGRTASTRQTTSSRVSRPRSGETIADGRARRRHAVGAWRVGLRALSGVFWIGEKTARPRRAPSRSRATTRPLSRRFASSSSIARRASCRTPITRSSRRATRSQPSPRCGDNRRRPTRRLGRRTTSSRRRCGRSASDSAAAPPAVRVRNQTRSIARTVAGT